MNIVAQSESDLFVKRLATILMDFLSHFITDKGDINFNKNMKSFKSKSGKWCLVRHLF